MNARAPRSRFDAPDGVAELLEPTTEVTTEEDEVLAALDRTEEAYRAARAAWVRDAQDLQHARDEAAAATEALRLAEDELRRARADLVAERDRAARHRERANRLAAALKDIHRALFSGNVYDLILKACLAVTGATRGLYVTAWGKDQFRVRSAVDVAGYPRKEASDFVRDLCRKVIADEKTLVANDPADLADLPAPDGPGETFTDLMAAPAVLLKQFNGVVILADKPGGFDPDDADVVMSIGDQAGVAVENLRLQEELLGAYFSIVGVLTDAIEAKDPYTHGHSQMVARHARQTAARLTDSDELRSVCCYGGLLHDIGKIGVSDGVLNKPGKLLPEEWTLMQSHVRIGREMLARVPALDGVADVVMYHHERYDGNGYPVGLKGDDIPLAARIVGVVDAFSAMTAKRSYKESMTADEARAELVRCKGSHFDPRVVEAFLAVLDEETPELDCHDGCGLPPHLDGATEFHHAIRAKAKPALPTKAG